MLISDSLGHTTRFVKPSKIVSLVPSWTEFLVDIGAENQIIGRTEYCIEPESILSVEAVGGTKNPDIQRIIELGPNIVLANKEENKQYDINRIRASGINVFVTSAVTIDQTLFEIKTLEWIITGSLIHYNDICHKLTHMNISNEFSFLYLIWKDPFMVAGKSTYISNLLEYMGGKNIITDQGKRYPTIELNNFIRKKPSIVFLPDEPYEFDSVDRDEIKEIFPESKVVLIDGKTLSWYGKRVAEAPKLIQKMIS